MTTHAEPYNLRDVPARGDGGTRFALEATPNGWSLPPGHVLANNLVTLAAEAEAEARAKQPETATVKLYAVVLDAEGRYRLRERGSIDAQVVSEPIRPGRFTRAGNPGQVLDSLFLREGPGYEKAPDASVWNAALHVAAEESLSGEALRQYNLALARALLVRAGLAPVHPSALPQGHLAPEPAEEAA